MKKWLFIFFGIIVVVADIKAWQIFVSKGNPIIFVLALLVSGVYVGILLASTVLPWIAQRISEGLYDPGKSMPKEENPYRYAQARVAQGDYVGAIESFRQVTETQKERFPWVEISKIQLEKLGKPQEAIETLQEAIANHEWPADDQVFFLFRMAEIHEHSAKQKDRAAELLRQVMQNFPGTRYSMNAAQKIKEIENSVD